MRHAFFTGVLLIASKARQLNVGGGAYFAQRFRLPRRKAARIPSPFENDDVIRRAHVSREARAASYGTERSPTSCFTPLDSVPSIWIQVLSFRHVLPLRRHFWDCTAVIYRRMRASERHSSIGAVSCKYDSDSCAGAGAGAGASGCMWVHASARGVTGP